MGNSVNRQTQESASTGTDANDTNACWTVQKIANAENKVKVVETNIHGITVDNNGTIYFTTWNGLHQLKKGHTKPQKLDSDEIGPLVWSGAYLFVCDSNRIIKYEIRSNTNISEVKILTKHGNTDFKGISGITVDDQGHLIVCDEDGVHKARELDPDTLWYSQPADKFAAVTYSHKLGSVVIFSPIGISVTKFLDINIPYRVYKSTGIIECGDNLIITGNYLLKLLHQDTLTNAKPPFFTPNELADVAFPRCLTKDLEGNIYVGTKSGEIWKLSSHQLPLQGPPLLNEVINLQNIDQHIQQNMTLLQQQEELLKKLEDKLQILQNQESEIEMLWIKPNPKNFRLSQLRQQMHQNVAPIVSMQAEIPVRQQRLQQMITIKNKITTHTTIKTLTIQQKIRRATGSGVWNHIKLFLVGDSGAGKTSVVRWLRKQDFVSQHISTDGIDIASTTMNDWQGTTFEIRNYMANMTYDETEPTGLAIDDLLNLLSIQTNDQTEFHSTTSQSSTSTQEIILDAVPQPQLVSDIISRKKPQVQKAFHIWDFAGQEEYYNTHHFFLSESAIYLLVVDISNQNQIDRLQFWIDSIRYYAKTAPILLIGTHKDKVTHPQHIMDKIFSTFQNHIYGSVKNHCIAICCDPSHKSFDQPIATHEMLFNVAQQHPQYH